MAGVVALMYAQSSVLERYGAMSQLARYVSGWAEGWIEENAGVLL